MNHFFKHLKAYREYILYSGMANLKKDVSGSFLGWMWWILDPFLHMMVYAFIAVIVFRQAEPHFVPFVFIGQAVWKYINSVVMGSVRMVRGNKGVLSRIYLPKYVLLLSNQFGFLIQLLITLGITLVISVLDGVQFTWYVLWLPVIMLILLVGSFGIGCLLLHLGVYATDLSKIMGVVTKLVFYLSGIFYDLAKRVPAPFGKLLVSINPAAMVIDQMRAVFVYGQPPRYLLLLVWAVVSLLLSWAGIRIISKNEQNYIKAV